MKRYPKTTGRPGLRIASSCAPCRLGAFTITELLIVIAIIAVLGSFLLAALVGARESAAKTKDMSQLGQIAKGCLQYANDWDRYLPARDDASIEVPNATGAVITDALADAYLNSTDILFCQGYLRGAFNAETADYPDQYCTYQYFNWYVSSPSGGSWQNSWSTEVPDMRRIDKDMGKYPLWACLTAKNADDTYLSHNVAGTNETPQGMAFVRGDTSTGWAIWTAAEHFHTQTGVRDHYWPGVD